MIIDPLWEKTCSIIQQTIDIFDIIMYYLAAYELFLICYCPNLLLHKTFHFLRHHGEDIFHRFLSVHVEVSPEDQAQAVSHDKS